MRRKPTIGLLFVLLSVLIPAAIPVPVCGMTGSGTSGDPYMIYDVNDLQDMDLVLTAYYELANDIDASATTGWNGGAGFDPIGNAGLDTVKFRGHFDGNGYTISNLWINRYGEHDVGLFGYTLGAEITNVNFHNCTIKGGGSHVGTVIGIGGNDVSYITVTDGDVYGGNYVGGFIGYADSGTYQYCVFSGNVTNNSDSYIGGFAGHQSGGTIYRCYSSANVWAKATSNRPYYIGGFIGGQLTTGSNAIIRECYAYGNLDADNYGIYVPYPIGGFVGRMYVSSGSATIYDSYSMVDVYSAEGIRVGGFVGNSEWGDCDIYRSYCTGPVYGASSVGGFAGKDDAGGSSDYSACFWDIETTGWPTSAGNANGLNTTDMQTESTFTDAGWDFDTIWGIGEGFNYDYPYLLWQSWPDTGYILTLWYEPTVMISGTTLPDHNSTQDGVITWGTFNSSVLLDIGEIEPYTPEEDEGEPDPGNIIPNPSEPEGWYVLCNDLEHLPFYTAFNDAALGMGMPDSCVLYMMMIMALAIAAGLGTMIFTGSVMASAMMTGSFLAVAVSTTVIGWWMIFVFIVMAAGILYLSRTA